MSPQGVMSRKKASYNPGLDPTKGHKFCPGAQTRTRDKLASLPVGVTKTSPLGPVQVTRLVQLFPHNLVTTPVRVS